MQINQRFRFQFLIKLYSFKQKDLLHTDEFSMQTELSIPLIYEIYTNRISIREKTILFTSNVIHSLDILIS